MMDSNNRKIEYLRISVTDRCNLRCIYCMPHGTELLGMSELLTYEEIVEVVEAASSLGIKRIKITGGEPLIRRGCPALISRLKKVSGIEQVTITTNGILLKENLPRLIEAGTDGINISLDTLNPRRFKEITGSDRLEEVLEGIDAALKTTVPVKINSVLMQGINDDEAVDLAELARERQTDVRFIEMMPIGAGAEYKTVSNDGIRKRLSKEYPGLTEDKSAHGNGPAVYVKIPGFKGSIGFISAIHGKFCSSCNRIRLTSTGRLKPCLCYGETVDLREIIRSERPDKYKLLTSAIAEAISKKPEQHCFEEPELVTEKKKMSSIGG